MPSKRKSSMSYHQVLLPVLGVLIIILMMAVWTPTPKAEQPGVVGEARR